MKRVCVAAILCCFALDIFSQSFETGQPNDIDPSQIDIVRDTYGVPHIFAATDREVAYGLAWAHAEDDFETIQKTILASKSMLGLYTGRDGAIVDYVVHLLRIRELVNEQYDVAISDQFKALLQGYCDGFNAFARTHPKEILLKRSFPVTPKDLVTYSVLQLALGCGIETELKKIFHGTVPLAEWQPQGSNAFAFNSKKTLDGNVFLAINTHHPLESQVSWYEAHLSSKEGLNILGGLFPGSPVIFTGVNDNLAWTHTVNHPDKIDVYQLEMNPDQPLQYKVDGEWHNLEETIVKLKVKVPGFNLHTKRKAYWSIYGPTLITDRGVFSIRTAGIMDIRGLEQWYQMSKAKNFSEFKNALKMEAHPGYNVVYGDKYDTIFYISNGKLPKRQPGFHWRGTLPGNTMKTRWTEFYQLEDLPQVLNPSSGYVYNTNHSPFKATDPADNPKPENYDPAMGYETHDNNRSLRVTELLQAYADKDFSGKISYEDFKKIKYDLQLPKTLAYPVNIDSLFLLDENEHQDISELIVSLKNWDRKASIESKGATIFGVCFYYVAARYQADETLKLMTAEMCAEALRYVKEYLTKHFGTTQVRFGDYQRLERGNKSLPLPGLPDVLAAMYASPSENGRVKGAIGECYIALIKFTPSGPEIETVNCFGASNRRGSQHYDDQMKLFQNQKTKKMTLNPREVYQEARTIYHPEIISRLPLSAKVTRGRR